MKLKSLFLRIGAILLLGAAGAADAGSVTVVTERLRSTVLRENRTGLDPNRLVKVVLPPGYAGSGRRYPVVYYLHNTFWSPTKMFEDGVPVLAVERTLQLKHAFLLEERLGEAAPQLRTMRGLALDWGAFDQTQDHVYANRQFSRKLTDLGIEHEAEEYNGNPYDKVWTEHGRFAARVLPFLERTLLFE